MSISANETAAKPQLHSLLEQMPSKECHCNRCGARIAEGDARCAVCGKKQQVKNTLLLDFLIAHTKDDITGKITDSIYEAVKNFLLSHLFGVVVSLSLVAAVGVTVYASEPYIARVASVESNVPVVEQQEPTPENEPEPQPEPEEEGISKTDAENAVAHAQIIDLLFDYWYTAFMKPETTTYGENGEQMTAAQYLETLKYPAAPADAPFELTRNHSVSDSLYVDYKQTILNADDLSTDTALQLAGAGVPVGETDVHFTFKDPSTGEAVSELAFRFTTAKGENGSWYVAANRQLSEDERLISLQLLSAPTITEDPAYDLKDLYDLADEYIYHMTKGDTEAMQMFWLPDSYGYSTVHQLPGIDTVIVADDGSAFYPDYPYTESIVTDRERMLSETSKMFADEGFATAECIVRLSFATFEEGSTATVIPEMYFLLTLVQADGQWCVAEDVLLYAVP